MNNNRSLLRNRKSTFERHGLLTEAQQIDEETDHLE